MATQLENLKLTRTNLILAHGRMKVITSVPQEPGIVLGEEIYIRDQINSVLARLDALLIHCNGKVD